MVRDILGKLCPKQHLSGLHSTCEILHVICLVRYRPNELVASLEGKALSLQQAKYTAPGGAAGEFCGAHKLPGMERVNTRRCQADACDKRAAFAPPGANSWVSQADVDRPCAKGETSPPEWRAGKCTCCASVCAAKPTHANKPAALAPRVLVLQSLLFVSLPVPSAFVQLSSRRHVTFHVSC